MVHPIALDRVRKGANDVLLADHLGEALWAVAAVKRLLRGHFGECIGGIKRTCQGGDLKLRTGGRRTLRPALQVRTHNPLSP